MKVKIIRVDKSLPLPEYKTSGAVAFDLYAREETLLAPQEIKLIPANFIIEVPPGYFLLIASRSGTFKKGLRMANGVGIIDQDFHGPDDELKMPIQNFSDTPISVQKGERLAQGIIVPILQPQWEEVEKIKDISRGGFGTTGSF